MATLQELAAHNSVRQQAAQARLRARIDKSETEQNEVLTRLMQHVIVDKLVPPRNLHFAADGHQFSMKVEHAQVGSHDYYTTHRHALGQIRADQEHQTQREVPGRSDADVRPGAQGHVGRVVGQVDHVCHAPSRQVRSWPNRQAVPSQVNPDQNCTVG